MEIQPEKISIIDDMFVRTADENYITARWCCSNGLFVDFLWLGLHAIEKYLKAILLANGRSAKGYGHQIDKLYYAVKEFAPECLPDKLTKPDRLDTLAWFDRTTESFVRFLLGFGNADNRYLLYGYSTHSPDLHMLDRLVWVLRRIIVPLDQQVVRSRADRPSVPTFRQVLLRQPTFRFTNGALPLDKLIAASAETPLRFAALNLNYSFAPDDFPHLSIGDVSSSFVPVLMRRILDPLAKGTPIQVAEAACLADWLFNSIHLPQDVVSDIKLAVAAAKKRYGLT